MMQISMVNVIISLLHMDDLSINTTHCVSPERDTESGYTFDLENNDLSPRDEGNRVVMFFTEMLLNILRCNLPSAVIELEQALSEGVRIGGRQALEWRVSAARRFIEEWEWRLSILQRLLPLSERQWRWKEALTVLRAAPSRLLNL